MHIQWPFDESQSLDPIGLAFMVFYILLLALMFIAMLFHRIGTFLHIMASTKVTLFTKAAPTLSGDDDLEKNALQIAIAMSNLQDSDSEEENPDIEDNQKYKPSDVNRPLSGEWGKGQVMEMVNRKSRKTRRGRKTVKYEDAFRKRMTQFPDEEKLSMTMNDNQYGTVRITRKLTVRRDTAYAVHRRLTAYKDRRPLDKDDDDRMVTIRAPAQRKAQRFRNQPHLGGETSDEIEVAEVAPPIVPRRNINL